MNTPDEIGRSLADVLAYSYGEDATRTGIGLATGSPGMALIYWLASQQSNATQLATWRTRHFERSAADLSELPLGPTLMTGSAGYLWLAEQLHRSGAESVEGLDDVVEEHDRALLQALHCVGGLRDYELLYGTTGAMQYAVCASPNGLRCELFTAATAALAELSQPFGQGLLIPTPSQSKMKKFAPEQVECDLGLAHGVPGTVATLAAGVARGLGDAVAVELLDSLSQGLLDAANPTGESVYPCNTVLKTESRMAWCYGDLGVANALYLAGHALGDAELRGTGVELALHAARRSRESYADCDFAVCHGVAGQALMFSIFHRRTGLPEIRSTKDALLAELLVAIESDRRLTDARTLAAGIPPEREDITLLNGTAGIAGVLLHELNPEAAKPFTDSLALYS